MEYLISVVLFAISSSITPGPNNVLVMTSGTNFGVRKSLPLLSGICVGFTVMLLLVGLGFGQIFSQFPILNWILKVVGIAYLLYLAFLIATSSNVAKAGQQAKPLTFLKGALFQWVNAKAWIVAISAISVFTVAGDQYVYQNLTLASTFLIVSFPCVGLWLVFGSLLRLYLSQDRYIRAFNMTMSLLLVISIVPVVVDVWQNATR